MTYNCFAAFVFLLSTKTFKQTEWLHSTFNKNIHRIFHEMQKLNLTGRFNRVCCQFRHWTWTRFKNDWCDDGKKQTISININNTSDNWKTEVDFKKNVTGVNFILENTLFLKPGGLKGLFGHCRTCLTKTTASAGQNIVWRVFRASLIACMNHLIRSRHTLNPALLILSSISGTLDEGDWLSWRALEFNSSRGTLISTTLEPAGFSRWLADFTSFTTNKLPEFLLFSFFVGDNLIVAFTTGNCILKQDRAGFATRLNGDHF